MRIIPLNRACEIWSIWFFLQVKFRSFLEILETFEKKVFLTVFKITVIKTNNSKISKKDQNLTCKKTNRPYFTCPIQ